MAPVNRPIVRHKCKLLPFIWRYQTDPVALIFHFVLYNSYAVPKSQTTLVLKSNVSPGSLARQASVGCPGPWSHSQHRNQSVISSPNSAICILDYLPKAVVVYGDSVQAGQWCD